MVLSLFAGRLLQLQGIDASAYAATAAQERLRSVSLPATRGAITDVNGVALATTIDTVNVTADQTLVKDPAATAALLAPVLGLDTDALAERLTGDRRFVYLAKQLPPQTWTAVRALDLAGIFSEPEGKRVYPAGEVAANIVGFLGGDGTALGGLELSLDSRLAGRDGQLRFEAGAGGRQIPAAASAERRPVPGEGVRLTVDRDIQWVAQRAVAAKVAETGAQSGTVVVMDPRTGQLLALATAPTFDPNQPGAAAASARGNRSLSEAYEPGSTGKVITAAALLEEGVVKLRTPFTVPNRLYRAGESFKDFEDHPTLRLTYAGTLAKSSNIGTVLAAERLGDLTELHPYFSRFGLGRPTGLGFPGETRGSLPAPRTWSASTGYTMTFGQGYSVNTVQMASAFATIANGGVRVSPSLVAGFDTPDGFRPAPQPAATRVVSERTARAVTTMMEAVTGDGGTAPNVRIPGYRVAGKTGTAQRVNDSCGCYRGYTMSFIGFAPADDPSLVVGVTLQDPRRGLGGGSTAGPVFRDVMAFALQNRGIPPTGDSRPKVRLERD